MEKIEQILLKEDVDDKLQAHLKSVDAFNQLPLGTWMNNCYAGILSGNSFERSAINVLSTDNIMMCFFHELC